MRRSVLLLIVLLISSKVFSQSLGGDIKSVSEIDQILTEVKLLSGNYPDSAITLALKGIKLSKSKSYPDALAQFYSNLAALYGRQANYPKALTYLDSALQLKDYVENSNFESDIKSFQGTLYADMGELDLATQLFDEALQLAIQASDTGAIIRGNLRLGVVFNRLDLIEQSRATLNKAIELAREKEDFTNLYSALNNLAVTYASREEYDEALKYFLEGEELERTHNPAGIDPILTSNIGRLYMLQENWGQAENYLLRSIEMAKERKQNLTLIIAYNTLGELFQSTGRDNLAEEIWNEALELGSETQAYAERLETLQLLSNFYASKGYFEEAYNLSKRSRTLNDSLSQIQRYEVVKEIETKYALEQKEAEVVLLQNMSAARLRQRNIITLALVITTALMVVLVILYRKSQKTARKLTLERSKLKVANDTKSQLFSIIGHDLRNPLNGILNGIDLLVSPDMSESEKQELAERISQSGAETLKVLEELLVWGRAASYDSRRRATPVGKVFDDVISVSEEQARQKGISLEKTETPANLSIWADANEVEFILRNFLSNAIKFSHRDSAVQLGIQLRPQHIVLEVRDYGVGLSSDKLTKIKNRDMITSYGTNNEKGSGLGLLICFDLAAKNEAEIEIDSEEGKGSTFRVVFPKL